jgi:hypothetical protein
VLAETFLALTLVTAPARLQVVADEFTLVLSRQSVQAGPALVELANLGEDSHDLRLRRTGSARTRTWTIHAVRPGRQAVLEAGLRPGRYRLWCSLADHRARGMRATLVVRAEPTRR